LRSKSLEGRSSGCQSAPTGSSFEARCLRRRAPQDEGSGRRANLRGQPWERRNAITHNERRFNLVNPVGGGLAALLFPLQKRRMFSRLGLPSSFKASEGLAPLSRWTYAFARPFQPTSFGRKSRNGRIPRSVVRPRLMMAHERRVGARQKRADCRKTTSAPWLERVSSPISTDGRQPFFPAASRNASLSRAYPSVPLFRGGNGRSSALIRAPPSREVRT
jgi:hypothetical protein